MAFRASDPQAGRLTVWRRSAWLCAPCVWHRDSPHNFPFPGLPAPPGPQPNGPHSQMARSVTAKPPHSPCELHALCQSVGCSTSSDCRAASPAIWRQTLTPEARRYDQLRLVLTHMSTRRLPLKLAAVSGLPALRAPAWPSGGGLAGADRLACGQTCLRAGGATAPTPLACRPPGPFYPRTLLPWGPVACTVCRLPRFLPRGRGRQSRPAPAARFLSSTRVICHR